MPQDRQQRFRRIFLIGAVAIGGIVLLIYLWTKNNSTSGNGTTYSPIGGGAGPYGGHAGQLSNPNGDGNSSQLYIVPFGSGAGTGANPTGANGTGVTIGGPAAATGAGGAIGTGNGAGGGGVSVGGPAGASAAGETIYAPPSSGFTTSVKPVTAASINPAVTAAAGGMYPVQGNINTVSPLTGQVGTPVTVGTQTVIAPPNVAAQGTGAGSPTVTVGAGYNTHATTPNAVYVAHSTYIAPYASSAPVKQAVPTAQTPGRVTGAPAGVINFRR